MTRADIGLNSWFSRRVVQTPDRPALTFEGVTRSYAQMGDAVNRLATALKAGGICRGDRVAYLGLNNPLYFDLLFATARLGAIFVPLNFRLTGPELDYIINDAGVHTLVADGPHRPVIDSVRASCLPMGRRTTGSRLRILSAMRRRWQTGWTPPRTMWR
jgi:fatty-acyl-CoA synthase